MKPLFLDIDTQNDFMLPAGALYVPGAESVLPVIAELNRFAVSKGFHLISTACSHGENDPEFQMWPPHCIFGTVGQRKPTALLVGQTIFEKQNTDVFRNDRWLPLLAQLAPTECFVYGVVTEVCVRFAAEGLLNLGYRVTVVTDAVQSLETGSAQEFLDSFTSKNGRLLTAAELMLFV